MSKPTSWRPVALWYNSLHCIKFHQPHATGIHVCGPCRNTWNPSILLSQLTVEQPSSSTITGSSPRPDLAENQNAKVEMVFRFWGSSAKPAGEGAGLHHAGVLALIEDAVAAKRGVFLSARDQIYVSGLKQPADALVVSRQVQLGLQGFRGKHAAGPIAVSIAIDASGTAPATHANAGDSTSTPQGAEPPHDLVTLLKLSKPAQILLTHDLCQQLAAIKGLPLKSFPGRFGVYEYLWTAEEKLDLLQSEPQLTLTALPVVSPSTPAKDKTGTLPAADLPVKTAAATQSHAEMVTEKGSAFQSGSQSSRMLILGAAAVVVLVAAILVGMHLMHTPAANSAPASAPQPSPVQTSAPAPVASPPVAPSAPPQASEKLHAAPAHIKPVTHPPAQVEEKPAVVMPAPAPVANCTLGANPERFVGLAEQARGRGDYTNAIRIFREVLDCDPNNAAAREGLDKATRGAQSQH